MFKRFSSQNRRFIVQVAVTAMAVRVAISQARAEGFSTSDGEDSKQQLTLYQYKICPFCNKVKALLNYMGVKYAAVEVSPLHKSQLSFTEHKKVPVIVINQEVLTESGNIVNYIIKNQSILLLNKKIQKLPANFVSKDSEQWSEWSEKKLAVMLYPNITRSFSESWECFEYTNNVKEWNFLERKVTHLLGAFFMSLANGKIKKKYGIVDERAELKSVLNEWTSAVKGKEFLHGKFVTLPDLMVYGVLNSIEGLTTFNEIMENDAALSAWYKRVGSSISSEKK